MKYKTGDTVWYVDILSNPPRIRQDAVIKALELKQW